MTIQSIGPSTARIALVGEFPVEQDLLRGQPFCSGGGFELSKMLSEAGTFRESCYITLVCNDRIPRGRLEGVIALKKKDITPQHVLWQGKWVMPCIVEGVERLKRELSLVKPNVVCAFGNLAMWVLTGEWGVTSWRSSIMESTLVPGLKVIPAISPNMLFGQWKVRPLIVHDLKRVVRQSHSPAIIRPNYSSVIRPSFEKAMETLDMLMTLAETQAATGTKLRLGTDIETRAGHIACIAFAWENEKALCIPLMCQHNAEGYWSAEEEAVLVYKMCQLMRICRIVGQNFNYDAQYIFRHWHFICPDVVDTMIQQHSCFSNMEKNLSFLSSMYLEDHLHWKDDRTNWIDGPKGEGEDKYWIYNCTDSMRTLAINTVLDNVVKAMGMTAVNDFQQSLAYPVLQTMLRGIRVDMKARMKLSSELLQGVQDREAWMLEVIGREINIKSPKQMAEFFYTEMGQKEIRKRQPDGSMSVTTNDEALHKIAEREPILSNITRKIAELRSLGVFHSTFVQAPLDIDGRIRTSFNICGTETYRFASSKNAFGTGLNCFPPGAEVLTESGWKTLETVQSGETIVAFDSNTETLKWQSAEPFSKDFEGDLCVAVTEQYRTTVTPDHRLLARKAGRPGYREITAKALSKMQCQQILPVGGDLEATTHSFSAHRLLVAALADGYYEADRVRFNFAKQRKCNRILALCRRYGIELHETKESQSGQRRFWFRKPADWPIAKKWDWWILGIERTQAKEMLDECKHWDGLERGNSFKFFTADKAQAEIIQTLAHICDQGATVCEQEQSAESWSTTLMYVVNVKPRNYVGTENKHWTNRHYKGKVYCVTVPSSFFLVRWEGSISVTGNCQNIPKGGETEGGGLELPNVRNLFVPDPGHTFFDIDLDSADLRIVTWESGCAWMKEHFKAGRKPYIEVMREYYHDNTMTKYSHPREYGMFKSLCHGTNYLGTADGIAPRIGLLVHECERIQKWYFGLAKEIKAWQEEIKKQVTKRRYVENVFGYRNYFFDKIEGTIFNQAVAWIPQSSVACLINRGYVNISNNLPEVEVLLQVHDSLAGQFETVHGDWALRRIVEEAQIPLPYPDPLVIPVGVVSSSKSWGECG